MKEDSNPQSRYINNRDRKFFNVAKAVAKTSNYHGTHVGCCVVYKGVAISVAANSEKTHPLQLEYNKLRSFDPNTSVNKLHAEIHALSLLVSSNKQIDWNKASIYIYREHKNGEKAISKPCPACYNLIKNLGIPYIYFIDEHSNYIKARTKDLKIVNYTN